MINNKSLSICRIILLSIFLLYTATIHAEVELPNGRYYENVDDLKVKVLGGYVSVKRTYHNRDWYFNRAWEPLRHRQSPNIYNSYGFMPDKMYGSAIYRNNAIYHLNSTTEEYYKSYHETGKWVFRNTDTSTITVTTDFNPQEYDPYIKHIPVSYRWEDKIGNWIEYEAYNESTFFNGRIIAYGDRYNVKVSMSYDTNGRLSAVSDHLDNQLLWYEYNVDGQVSRIYDYTNREVKYYYTDNKLTKVTDVLGNDWLYTYDSKGRLETTTDPEGQVNTITYYENSKVKSVKDLESIGDSYQYEYNQSKGEYYLRITSAGGRSTEQWYDSSGLLIRTDIGGKTVSAAIKDGRNRIVTDRAGNKTTNVYDEWENLIKVIHPDGSEKSTKFDPKYSNVLEEKNENGVITRYDYDANGNRIRMTEAFGLPEQRITEYAYDAYGNLIQEKRIGDAVTAETITLNVYDTRGNLVSLTDPEGNITEYIHDVMGNDVTFKDGRGNIWLKTYDAAGRKLSQSDPLGNTTRYEYDKIGNLVKISDAANNPTLFEYDNRNNLISRTDALDGRRLNTYDVDNNLVKQEDEEGKIIQYVYDAEGRINNIIDGNGNEIRYMYEGNDKGAPTSIVLPTFERKFKYNNRGLLIESIDILSASEHLTTKYSYDSVGNLVSTTDQKGRVKYTVYDSLNRKIKIIDPLSQPTEWFYDDRDNLLSLKDPNGNIHRFEYDKNNRVENEIRPMGEGTQYIYDGAGNQTHKIDAKGQKTEHQYDPVNRLVTINYYSASDPVSPQETANLTYNTLGGLVAYDDGITSAMYGYDALQRKLSEIIDYGSFSLGYSYAYYANGTKKNFTGPDGVKYEYGYDAANLIKSVKIPGLGSIVINSYQWSSPTKITFPGGTIQELAVDNLVRLKSINVKDPANNILMDYQYTFDEAGNITQKNTEHGTYTYNYDAIDRLIGADNPGLPDEDYTYDSVGNRLSDGRVTGSWDYNENNELLSYNDITYTYDDNGNTVQKTSSSIDVTFGYNIQNRLIRIYNDQNDIIANYYYDPFGRRLWKEGAGNKKYFLYADEGLIGEYDATGTQTSSYGYLGGQVQGVSPIWQKIDNEYYFYQNDHLGTPQLLTTQEGDVVWSTTYDTFGSANINISEVENNIRFPGQYYDPELGLHYNYYRDYDPNTGRYLESDPIGLTGGLNLYRYAKQNPVKWFDRLGRAPENGSGGRLPPLPDRPKPIPTIPAPEPERKIPRPKDCVQQFKICFPLCVSRCPGPGAVKVTVCGISCSIVFLACIFRDPDGDGQL